MEWYYSKGFRSAPFIRNTPFIITSSSEDNSTLRRTVLAGADDFLAKPIDIEFLKLKAYCIIHRAKRMDILSEASYLGRFSPKYFSDILQLISTTKRSGLMRIIRGPALTQLWFRKGEVRFARDESVEGVQAIFNLVRASNGRFEFIDKAPLDAVNINKPQMFLLLEFSRKLDVYNSSRKVNLKREFAADEEKLQQLLASEAEKYLPDVIENCKVLLAKGYECIAAEDHVENAEAVKVKLYETLEWASLELKRLRLEFKRAEKVTARIQASEKPNQKPVEEKKKPIRKVDLSEGIENLITPPKGKQHESRDTDKSSSSEDDFRRIELPSSEKQANISPPKKETKKADPEQIDKPVEPSEKPQETIVESQTFDVSEGESDESEGVFGENWDEFIKTVQSKLKDQLPEDIEERLASDKAREAEIETEETEKTDEPLSDAVTIPPKLEDNPELSPNGIEYNEKHANELEGKRQRAPRLIQRFPADVVEMMQVELGKADGTLIKQSDFKRFSDSIKHSRNVFSLPISKASSILSESYYSSSNVMTVLVAGSPLGLQKFFSTINGVEIDKQKEGYAYLARIPADFSQVLYIIGLRFDELDSFEAESILDRGQGAVIVTPIEEVFFEISIDSLSLAMVKYQRHRVFIVSDEETIPARVLNQARIYSLSVDNIIASKAFRKAELEELFDKVVAAFSPVTVL